MASRHYDVLQLQPNATAEEIQHAYRRLAMRYHPDRNSSPDAAAKMAAINEAYEILRDGSRTKSPEPAPAGPLQESIFNADLEISVRNAARAIILRHGWSAVHEDEAITIFALGKGNAKVALVDHLTTGSSVRVVRRFNGLTAILAVRVDMPFVAGSTVTVVDLMRAERYGAAVSEGPAKTLLSAFM